MIGHMGSHEWRSDVHPADRIAHLEDQVHILTGHVSRRNDDVMRLQAEVERLKKTEQFLRSERPMARRLTELEDALEKVLCEFDFSTDNSYEVFKLGTAALKKEKP